MSAKDQLLAAFDAAVGMEQTNISMTDIGLMGNQISNISTEISMINTHMANISMNSNSLSSLVSIDNNLQLLRQVIEAKCRPSAIYKPDLFKDGDTWMVTYGLSPDHRLVAHGDSPALAMESFDEAWVKG